MFALLGQIEILHYFVRSAAPYVNRIVTVRRRKDLKTMLVGSYVTEVMREGAYSVVNV